MNWRRSSILRKSAALALRLPRAAARLRGGPHPPVLANSVPKSGTHLLIQVLEVLPGTRGYGTFLASMPSLTFRERPPQTMARKITRLTPGELAPAHLFHSPQAEAALHDANAVHYLIYRDPRDVAISEAHYLTHMNRWHRMHRLFRALPDDAARLRLAIEGLPSSAPYDYPDIAARYRRYTPWLGRPGVCAVRFEDLAGPQRYETVRKIVGFYAARTADRAFPVDMEALTERAIANIAPKRSHTFRAGRIGTWKDTFTDAHRALMKHHAGDLLIELGYEPNEDW